MPYTNPTVARWTDHGEALCLDCPTTRPTTPVDSGNCALEGVRCDGCGVDLGELYDPGSRVPVGGAPV